MKQITPSELRTWQQNNKDFILIDVREDWEREIFNIGGLHIPMGSIIGSLNEIPQNKDVVLYCEKGIRSVIAIQRLETYGFTNLINLSGGIKAWGNE